MLARGQRLTEKKDFQTLFSRGAYLSTPLYTMRWRKTDSETSRFGFVVANTISKKATVRNTLRRRLRESVRRNMGALPFVVDAAIIAKHKIMEATYKEIEEDIIRSFQTMEHKSKKPYPRQSGQNRTPLHRMSSAGKMV